MRSSITVNILIAFIAKANAKEFYLARNDSVDDSADELVSDLFDRALKASLPHANFDDATLRKLHSHSEMPMTRRVLASSCADCEQQLAKTSLLAPARLLTTETLEQSTDANAAASTESEKKIEEKPDDGRSIWVGNVEYGTTVEELHSIFSKCGTINRITIKTDKEGNSKAFAYIEFVEPSSVELALTLEGTDHRGRPLKVSKKRSNVNNHPSRRGRGGGFDAFGMMGRGGMGGMRGFPMMMMPMMPMGRGGGRKGR